MNLSMNQKQTQIERTDLCQGGRWVRKEWTGTSGLADANCYM